VKGTRSSATRGTRSALGKFDAVIHNAGVGYREPRKITTVDGHAQVLAVNVLAPYRGSRASGCRPREVAA
jgi:NAD(P)-dependent dehydrogenase (short-subunit alcohol dehydrogenase family)